MIEVCDVSKQFGTFLAINNVNFSIPTGQIVGLLGPNGAGKTTTMRIITGFLAATSGRVLIDGKDITQDPVASKQKIGYCPESSPLYSDMIVYDYLCYVARMHHQDESTRVPVLCKECGLAQVMSKNIAELSRGNKQRVALAHALMNDPEILILDEPTSGLDPNQVEDVRTLIKELGKTRTVIISTHILSEVEQLCSRVIIINNGKVVADSPTESLRTKYASKGVIRVVAEASTVELSNCLNSIDDIASLSFETSKKENSLASNLLTTVLINVKGEHDIRPAVAKAIIRENYDLYSMDMEKNSLEDIFHMLTVGDNFPK